MSGKNEGANAKGAKKVPTRKQFKMARDLAAAAGADIPNEVLYDRRTMSGFIAGLKAARG